jgi:ferritin-like protein
MTVSGNVASDPPAEPELKVDTREELVYLLGQACEIEHGLMCEYLYAQFSLKRAPDEGLTPDQLTRVQAWEAAMINVIKQEMLHLALATNILTAIGAAPHFERPNFPILSRCYPQGVDDAGLVAVPEEWQTVGHLYRGIEAGLANLCARYGEDAVFIGPTRAQAVTDIFEWPELIAVSDLGSASHAIETIVEQGEGARGDWIRSHFGTFVGILEDLLAEQAADPGFNPARPGRSSPPSFDCRPTSRPGRSIPPRPHGRPHLRHRPTRHPPAAAPRRGMEDHQGTARCITTGLRFPRRAGGPRRAHSTRRQAGGHESRHRKTRLHNGRLTASSWAPR